MLAGKFMASGVTKAIDEMSAQSMTQVHVAMNGVMAAVEAWLEESLSFAGHTIADIDKYLLETHDLPPESMTWSRLYKLRYYADRLAEPAGRIVSELPVKLRFIVDGPLIVPPRLPVLTVDADGNHMLRWDDGSPLRTEVHVLAAASTPVGTLTVDGGAVTVVGPGETVRLHSRLREDGTLEWVTDKTVVEPEEEG